MVPAIDLCDRTRTLRNNDFNNSSIKGKQTFCYVLLFSLPFIPLFHPSPIFQQLNASLYLASQSIDCPYFAIENNVINLFTCTGAAGFTNIPVSMQPCIQVLI